MEKCTDDTLTASQQAVIKNIWLNYYNNILLQQGIITEKAYRQMKVRINSKYPTRKS